jgi:hypothetical protein
LIRMLFLCLALSTALISPVKGWADLTPTAQGGDIQAQEEPETPQEERRRLKEEKRKMKRELRQYRLDHPDPEEEKAKAERRKEQEFRMEHPDPDTARLYSLLLPGGGQFYNRQPVKGGVATALFVGGGLCLIAGTYAGQEFIQWGEAWGSLSGNYSSSPVNTSSAHPLGPLFYVGLGVILTDWTWSVLDAQASAKVISQAHPKNLSLNVIPIQGSPGLNATINF